MNMLEKGLLHKNTPSVNPQSWTNVGGVLSALAVRTTCQESYVALIFRCTSQRENRFWGKWGKAGYRNGPELSRTISKLGTISNLAGIISFFREKWLELFQFFGKNGWNYFVFVWIFSGKCHELFHLFRQIADTFLFQRRHRNFPFQQPSTSCLVCPVRTWLTELKLSCLKVKHGNNTKRPHTLGTSTRDTRKRRTLPCGSLWAKTSK